MTDPRILIALVLLGAVLGLIAAAGWLSGDRRRADPPLSEAVRRTLHPEAYPDEWQ